MQQRAEIQELIEIAPEVREALAARGAVVALESTIITHGMPFPENAGTAKAVEALIRAEGAVPATVAVAEGKIRIGLSTERLDRLAAAKDAVKASRRDLAALIGRKATGGTTVAATMRAAAAAGLPIFATGGIGGVHRGAEKTFDVSADLMQLARTPVAVVCAGAKSILDVGKTLEILETHGVPVLGYRTDDFPGFLARSSGHKVDHRFDTPGELAYVIDAQRRLPLETGMVIANPIPPDDALPQAEIEAAIAAACRDAESAGIAGKALTPFLLARVNEASGGRSLAANIALVKNNAVLAARIAVELAKLAPE
jgi:pseudouridine-5'-phosphate glycosidase